ncbi:uncharacterized protein LOC117779507, partial [Drosophila innubila]|uniref:uncharacterized protein LOC117779507 n=1 Tax=Drosophila innubila TaxID=198719 RepID=UPI00148C0A1B
KKDVVIEDVISPFGSLQRAVEFAIELGMNIGLLSLTEEKVLMPFKLKPSASNIKNTALPPTQCRSLIKRLAKTMRTTQANSCKNKKRASVKAKSKSRKATYRIGTTRRPWRPKGQETMYNDEDSQSNNNKALELLKAK